MMLPSANQLLDGRHELKCQWASSLAELQPGLRPVMH